MFGRNALDKKPIPKLVPVSGLAYQLLHFTDVPVNALTSYAKKLGEGRHFGRFVFERVGNTAAAWWIESDNSHMVRIGSIDASFLDDIDYFAQRNPDKRLVAEGSINIEIAYSSMMVTAGVSLGTPGHIIPLALPEGLTITPGNGWVVWPIAKSKATQRNLAEAYAQHDNGYAKEMEMVAHLETGTVSSGKHKDEPCVNIYDHDGRFMGTLTPKGNKPWARFLDERFEGKATYLMTVSFDGESYSAKVLLPESDIPLRH